MQTESLDIIKEKLIRELIINLDYNLDILNSDILLYNKNKNSNLKNRTKILYLQIVEKIKELAHHVSTYVRLDVIDHNNYRKIVVKFKSTRSDLQLSYSNNKIVTGV